MMMGTMLTFSDGVWSWRPSMTFWRVLGLSMEVTTEIFLHGDLESGLHRGRTDEASTFHRRADHRCAEGARGRGEDRRSGAQARRLRGDALQLESEVWRDGRLRG